MKKYQYLSLSFILIASMIFVQSSAFGFAAEPEPSSSVRTPLLVETVLDDTRLETFMEQLINTDETDNVTNLEQQKLADYNLKNANLDSLIKEYGLIFNAEESDSVYDLVLKKEALIKQHLQSIANQPDNFDISLEPISLDDERGYRLQLKVQMKQEPSVESKIPDFIVVIFSGELGQNSLWPLISQEIDLSPLKTANNMIDKELNIELNSSFDKLLVQINSDPLYTGIFDYREFLFDIPETDIAELSEEADTVNDMVSNQKEFNEQYQQLLTNIADSISIEPISLGEENSYRFRIKASSGSDNSTLLQALPDQMKVGFIGVKSNLWQSVYGQTIDITALKTPGGTIDIEVTADFKDSFEQLAIQVHADSLDAGLDAVSPFFKNFMFQLPSSEENVVNGSNDSSQSIANDSGS